MVRAGGVADDGVAGNQHMVPGVARGRCDVPDAVWTDFDSVAIPRRHVRHYQVADGGVREGLSPRHRPPGKRRIPKSDTADGSTALESQPVKSVAPGNYTNLQVPEHAVQGDIRLPVAVDVAVDGDV